MGQTAATALAIGIASVAVVGGVALRYKLGSRNLLGRYQTPILFGLLVVGVVAAYLLRR